MSELVSACTAVDVAVQGLVKMRDAVGQFDQMAPRFTDGRGTVEPYDLGRFRKRFTGVVNQYVQGVHDVHRGLGELYGNATSYPAAIDNALSAAGTPDSWVHSSYPQGERTLFEYASRPTIRQQRWNEVRTSLTGPIDQLVGDIEGAAGASPDHHALTDLQARHDDALTADLVIERLGDAAGLGDTGAVRQRLRFERDSAAELRAMYPADLQQMHELADRGQVAARADAVSDIDQHASRALGASADVPERATQRAQQVDDSVAARLHAAGLLGDHPLQLASAVGQDRTDVETRQATLHAMVQLVAERAAQGASVPVDAVFSAADELRSANERLDDAQTAFDAR